MDATAHVCPADAHRQVRRLGADLDRHIAELAGVNPDGLGLQAVCRARAALDRVLGSTTDNQGISPQPTTGTD